MMTVALTFSMEDMKKSWLFTPQIRLSRMTQIHWKFFKLSNPLTTSCAL